MTYSPDDLRDFCQSRGTGCDRTSTDEPPLQVPQRHRRALGAAELYLCSECREAYLQQWGIEDEEAHEYLTACAAETEGTVAGL